MSRKNDSAANENITNNNIHSIDIASSAKSLLRNIPANISPTKFPAIIVVLSLLSGVHTLISTINPTIESKSVAAVEMSEFSKLNALPQKTSAPTANTSATPPGIAFLKTFGRNLPSIRDFSGSNAKKNPGIPIVNIVINETCEGSSGYLNTNINESRDSKNENIFFTKNSPADLWMLLTTRLPSSTTFGIFEKSLSKSTTCETWHAASLPEDIATLQSASLSARTSFTPSPVIATVFPISFSRFTILRFISGVTRPKTVYLLSASISSLSSVIFEASIKSFAPSIPACNAILETVIGLSPEITLILTPSSLKYSNV